MSRSRINYDKARRDANARAAHNPLNLPVEREVNGIPAKLHMIREGNRLKPSVTSHFLETKQPKQEWRLLIANLIRKSELEVITEESGGDGARCLCEMKIKHDHEAYMELEHFSYFVSEIDPSHDLIGSQWVMRFWFQKPSVKA